MLDQAQGGLVNHVLFQCPTEKGKGVLVSPTAHGNLIVGPDAMDAASNEDVGTTQASLDYVREMAASTGSHIADRDNSRNFAGKRALIEIDHFLVDPSKSHNHLIHL